VEFIASGFHFQLAGKYKIEKKNNKPHSLTADLPTTMAIAGRRE